jgi:hypothetical protein
MGEATERALAEVAAARATLGAQVDELDSAARSALDVRAKLRRNPVKAAGLVGGAAFLATGGPKRVLRGVSRRLRRTPPAPRSLLPEEIQHAVESLGADAPAVKARLEREFADYLAAKRKDARGAPNAVNSFWKLFDSMAGPIGSQAARRLVEQFLAADPKRRDRPAPKEADQTD